jgi:CRP-like cAMP-binding protein
MSSGGGGVALSGKEGRPVPPLTDAPPEANRLLAALPAADYARLLPALEPVRLEHKQVLTRMDAPIDHVYFPRDAVTSILVPMDDGQDVEGATVGNEGLIGLPVFLGDAMGTELVICQVPGAAFQITIAAVREVAAQSPALVRAVHRYTLALMGQMNRTAGCNRIHPVDERCARWLLMTADRVGRDTFSLTQEFLAAMLGVRRASVTTAAGMLQQAGFITYRYGQVRIVDRDGLEQAACEDYRLSKALYDRLYAQAGN